MRSKFSPIASSAPLSAPLIITAAIYPATAQEPSAVTSENYVELFDFGVKYSHDPHKRRTQLKRDTFQKKSEEILYGRKTETYKKLSRKEFL